MRENAPEEEAGHVNAEVQDEADRDTAAEDRSGNSEWQDRRISVEIRHLTGMS